MASLPNATTEQGLDSSVVALAISGRDPLGRIEEASFWLEAYTHTVQSHPLRVFRVVDQLDAVVQVNRLALTQEYLGARGRMQTYREHRIWNAMVRFARSLADGYEACLRMVQAEVPGAHELQPWVAVVAARTIRAHTLELRWALLRYTSVDPSIWSRMGVVYAFSDRNELATARLKVYPEMGGDSTVRREYLRGLILSVSGMGNLLPAEQVIAERVVAAVAEFFLLHRQPAAGCHFAVDVRSPRAPYRITRELQPLRGRRFFGPGDAGVMVEGFIRQTDEGRVPSELRLPGEFAAEQVAGVLKHLARQWAAEPPARSEARHRVLMTMQVAHGFERVLAAVSIEAGDTILDELTEAWTVENESEGGFGSVLPLRDGDWLSVGTLIAAKPTWPSAWSVGVIRRVSARNPLHRSVGVERLARGGVAVRLTPLRAEQWVTPMEGILLPSEGQTGLHGGQVTIVLRPGSAQLEFYEMRVCDRPYVLSHRGIDDSGEDFEIVRFAIRAG